MMTHSALADRIRDIVDDFSLFDNWMEKYEYLIELGRSLPIIDEAYKTDAYKIHGCQSQVWLRAERNNGHVVFTADSDALITKGLIALLVRVFSDQPASEIARADLSFLDEIGMKEHLSPTRKNGLNEMVNQMKRYALAFTQ